MTCAVGFFVADASAQESLPKRVRELLDGTLSTNLTVVITVTHLCVLTYQKTHQEGLELVGSVHELEEILVFLILSKYHSIDTPLVQLIPFINFSIAEKNTAFSSVTKNCSGWSGAQTVVTRGWASLKIMGQCSKKA